MDAEDLGSAILLDSTVKLRGSQETPGKTGGAYPGAAVIASRGRLKTRTHTLSSQITLADSCLSWSDLSRCIFATLNPKP